MSIIELDNITKSYENHVAVDDLSLHIPAGSIYGLIGPNGLLKCSLARSHPGNSWQVRSLEACSRSDRCRIVHDPVCMGWSTYFQNCKNYYPWKLRALRVIRGKKVRLLRRCAPRNDNYDDELLYIRNGTIFYESQGMAQVARKESFNMRRGLVKVLQKTLR